MNLSSDVSMDNVVYYNKPFGVLYSIRNSHLTIRMYECLDFNLCNILTVVMIVSNNGNQSKRVTSSEKTPSNVSYINL